MRNSRTRTSGPSQVSEIRKSSPVLASVFLSGHDEEGVMEVGLWGDLGNCICKSWAKSFSPASGGPSSSGMSRQHSNMARDLESRERDGTERNESPWPASDERFFQKREGRRLPTTAEQVPVYCTVTHSEALEPAAAAPVARHEATGSAAVSAALSSLRLASACPTWTWYGSVWHFP
jgi:hypothetical protein